MPYYVNDSTGLIGKWLRDPGAGYTLISAMPAGGDRPIAEWWRARDLTTDASPIASSWHPSVPENSEPET